MIKIQRFSDFLKARSDGMYAQFSNLEWVIIFGKRPWAISGDLAETKRRPLPKCFIFPIFPPDPKSWMQPCCDIYIYRIQYAITGTYFPLLNLRSYMYSEAMIHHHHHPTHTSSPLRQDRTLLQLSDNTFCPTQTN